MTSADVGLLQIENSPLGLTHLSGLHELVRDVDYGEAKKIEINWTRVQLLNSAQSVRIFV